MPKARGKRGFLSGAPSRLWPDAVVHHGVRVAAVVAIGGGLAVLFPSDPGVSVGRWRADTVAGRDVIAEVEFEVPRDAVELEAERRQAAESVIPTFVFQPSAQDSVLRAFEGLFVRLDSAAASSGTAGVDAALSAAGIDVGQAQVGFEEAVGFAADAESRTLLYARAVSAVQTYLPAGVMAPGPASEVTTDSVRIVRSGRVSLAARSSVLSGREFYDQAVADLASDAERELLRTVLARYLVPSLVLDAERTNGDRRAAVAAVPVNTARVLRGEAIVRERDQVTEDVIRAMEAYRAALRVQGLPVDASDFRGAAGGVLLSALLLGCLGVLIFLYRRELYRSFRSVLAIVGIFAAYFLAAFLVARLGLPPVAVPVTFASIVLAILWDGRLSFAAASVLAALTALQQPFSATYVFVAVLAGGTAAALSVRAFRRLSQTWVFIGLIASAYALALFGLHLRGADFDLWVSLGAALGSTVLGAIVAIGFLPVFEWLTGITTDQTLIGWADLDRPLLRRLAVEAPGTYAHTMQVAALAEAGAGAIGANVLLCRAGAYYHDVGKIVNPGHFIENQHGDNPHDRLEPAESASRIRAHVDEGIKLARREKVPGAVAAFIPEHHGEQSVGYFLAKAEEQAAAKDEEPPDPKLFRYPGPRPQSRETGIAMLADAVESAARVLKAPTEERIKALVDRIFSNRATSGQLDDTSLTFGELAVLKERFTEVLAGMYHQRIDYPETSDLSQSAPEPDAAEPDAADAVAQSLPKDDST